MLLFYTPSENLNVFRGYTDNVENVDTVDEDGGGLHGGVGKAITHIKN